MTKTSNTALVAALVCVLSSCAQKPAAPQKRTAILRFENLTGDPSLDWMGRAFAEILQAQLSGARRDYVLPGRSIHTSDRVLGRQMTAAPGISAERIQAVMASANRMIYGYYE